MSIRLTLPTLAAAAMLALAPMSHAQNQSSAPEKSASDAKAMHDKSHHGKKGDKAMTDKAAKPMDDAASMPTAKKPAKQGAQSGPAPAASQ